MSLRGRQRRKSSFFGDIGPSAALHSGTTVNLSPFAAAAHRHLSDLPEGDRILRVLDGIHSFVHENNWQGACHATTACGFVLLGAQGIASSPCLGEVVVRDELVVAFDHSWLEIGGKVFDVAITNPLEPSPAFAAVIGGRHIDTGEATTLHYGAVSGQPQWADAQRVARMTIGEYMDGFPERDGLWSVARAIADSKAIALPSTTVLRAQFGRARWELRPQKNPPEVSTDAARRARNEKKRSRQSRR